MGDYWHSNPLIYDSKLNSMQIRRIYKDKTKHTYITKYYNIEILYLWENDIYNRLDVCKELIKIYIANHGILTNYHSFNYKLNEGKLELKNEIIKPYFEATEKIA